MRNEQNGLSGKHNRLYKTWHGMVSRCTNPRMAGYGRYGGRGITVDDAWVESFPTFCAWALQNGYAAGLSLDRVDNEAGYSPSNCRWVTAKVQANNRSDNTLYEYLGQKLTLPDVSKLCGVNFQTLRSRIKAGWQFDRAVSPVLARGTSAK